MIVYYHPRYNIDLGILNALHPFDGRKFAKVAAKVADLEHVVLESVSEPVSQAVVDEFVSDLLRLLLPAKRYILRALEVPYIPLLPFSVIDNRILGPMRWAVAGTIAAARKSLTGTVTWNLSGGYHHASKQAAEGFCIYNDIGIALQQLAKEGSLSEQDEVLIVDVDAHHGNGNAYVFMEDRKVNILDIYNGDIYPRDSFTKQRLDINIPLRSGTLGDEYLSRLESGLSELKDNYKVAFVIAGTDVLEGDPLGHLGLSVDDCVARDKLVLDKLQSLSVPAVVLGGGGYSKDSATTIAKSIAANRLAR